MPDIKFSDMSVSTKFSGNDYVPIISGGTNKRILASTMFANIQDQVVLNSLSGDVDTTIRGVTDPHLFFVDASTNRVGVSTNAPSAVLDVDGDLKVNGPEYNTSYVVQSSSGSVSLASYATIVDSTSPIAVQLGSGSPGQYKQVFRKGTGSLTLNFTAATLIGGTSITFNAVGSSVKLQYIDSNWYIVSAYNITVA